MTYELNCMNTVWVHAPIAALRHYVSLRATGLLFPISLSYPCYSQVTNMPDERRREVHLGE